MKVSICIPTFNRARHLTNCLQSIVSNEVKDRTDFEVCVSDNGSTDDTEQVVRRAQDNIDIKYHRNPSNLGIPRNFLNVVDIAQGDFVWLLGDDDLLIPGAIAALVELIDEHPEVDFFYINSFHLTTEYVLSCPQPFDTAMLPKEMKPFSSWSVSGEMRFMDLVDPRVSFDFLGGMFLSVFRRRNWLKNVGALDPVAVCDPRTFSHFDNTFPHVKIFARAFATSKAFFNARPLSVCLTGAREWSPMYPLVVSVRLVEALEEYRRNGLPYMQYLRCRNYALNNFVPDLGSMFINRKHSGFEYVNPMKLVLSNVLYPNFYLSLVNFLIRKSKLMLDKSLHRARAS